MDKDLIITNEANDKIINPDVVKKLKDAGYYVVSESLMKQFLDDELELVKIKESMKGKRKR